MEAHYSSKENLEIEFSVKKSSYLCNKKRAVLVASAIIIVIIIITIAVVVGVTVANKSKSSLHKSKSTQKYGCGSFTRPAVILIYTDGFRPDYLDRGYSPAINQLAKTGVRAKAMRSQFPTTSYPNLHTITTGLYPESHGMVSNSFLNEHRNETFAFWTPSVKEFKWWHGEPDYMVVFEKEPKTIVIVKSMTKHEIIFKKAVFLWNIQTWYQIWVTAKKQGVKSAVYYFWPESAEKEDKPDYWTPYDNGKASFDSRVDKVLEWLEMEASSRPYFISMYVALPDTPGHNYGPDSPENNAGVKKVDDMVAKLTAGIKNRNLDSCTNVIIVSDHGMANVSCTSSLYLDTMTSMSNFTVFGHGPFLSIYAKSKDDAQSLVGNLKCKNEKFYAFAKDDIYLPKRLHYSHSKRIGDVIVLPEIGWRVYSKSGTCAARDRGQHGYDNVEPLMAALFVASGPSFKNGIIADEFSNIELYNLMAEILKLKPAPNNGTAGSLSYLLKTPTKDNKKKILGDGNNFSMDCSFPTDLTNALKNCSYCTCWYCSYDIYKNLTTYRMHLNLSKDDAQKSLNTHLPWGTPKGGAGKQGCILTQKHYIIGYSGYLHIPLWVAYKMTATQLNTNIPRKNCFRRDIRLSNEQSSHCSDYSRSGYDRGHMAPNGDFNFDRFAEQDTYILSNIAPQNKYFNRNPGLWFKAEGLFREWAQEYGTVYVMSGSIFDANSDGLRDKDENPKRWVKDKRNSVAIPSHFYKIIMRCNENASKDGIPGCNGRLEALSFVFPHNEEKDCKLHDWKKRMLLYTASISDIEKLTGSDLFPDLPYPFAARFKSQLLSKLWPIPNSLL